MKRTTYAAARAARYAIVVASLGSGSAFAQTASQITPPTYASPAVPRTGPPVIAADTGTIAPAGSEAIDVRLFDVQVEGRAIDPATLAELRARLIGKTVKVSEMFAAAHAIEVGFARRGHVLTRVVVPAQSLADGATLRLIVVEGYIERIDTSHVPSPVARRIAAILKPLEGDRSVTKADIERKLLLAADIPGVQIRSTLAAGSVAGATVLVVEATHRPVTGFVTVDNTLPSALGRDAFGIGLNVNGALGFGETLYLRASGLPNTGRETSFLDPTPRNRALAAGFILPIGNDGLTLNVEGTDARTAPRRDAGLPGFGSNFRRLSGRLRYPVVRSRALTASVEADFDAQDERVRIISPIVLPLSLDRLRIARVSGDVRAYLAGGGVATALVRGSLGLDVLGARSAADATPVLPLSRQGATASFQKLELAASIDQPVAQHLSVSLQGHAQTAFGQVMANSEQIGLASLDALSPLPSGTLQGDAGYVGRGELRVPFGFSIGKGAGQLAPYGFGAYGGVRFENPTAFERRATDAYAYGGGVRILGSAGPNAPGVSASIEYGRAHIDGFARETDRVSFTIVTQF